MTRKILKEVIDMIFMAFIGVMIYKISVSTYSALDNSPIVMWIGGVVCSYILSKMCGLY